MENINAKVFVKSVVEEDFEDHTVRVSCKVDGHSGMDQIVFSSESKEEAEKVKNEILRQFNKK